MSRISEALRQAEVDGGNSLGVEDRGGSFHSPWSLGEPSAQSERNEPDYEVAIRRSETTPAPVEVNANASIDGFAEEWRERLVVSRAAEWQFVEQFRRLAATLHQAQAAGQVKVILVTSASPGDGKTLTAINLALVLSESYRRRVLLMDADLRRPSIRDVTHLPHVLGLSEGLRSAAEPRLTVLQITPNLALLPAGRPDPDPLGGLTSPRMRRIIEDAASRFDWVILDAPPLGTVTDASLLAGMSDGALLVVRAGYTQCPLVMKAIDAIGRERILGVVLNDVQRSSHLSYGDYYAPYGPRADARS